MASHGCMVVFYQLKIRLKVPALTYTMQIAENYNLKSFNTFGITASASRFYAFDRVQDLAAILKANQGTDKLILGGGSNILFTRDYQGLLLKNNLKGISLVKEDHQFYYVKAAAGEPWHPFVQYCVGKGYGGLENLSLIPGLAGASPMQNIGAYGVEIRDVFYELEAMRIQDQTLHIFSNENCQFGYRQSIFKTALKEQFIILSVTYRLQKNPVLHLEYGAIREELQNAGIDPDGNKTTIKDVAEAVIRIRQSKLPDPAKIGNAGSFFKNPVISTSHFEKIKSAFPDLPGYPIAEDPAHIKVAAGWLIEATGWKGYRQGDAGVHARQALVLVNYGQASGAQILALSQKIIESVAGKFGIHLEREVNII